ncbi:hypothetical protein BC939DRAFT_441674 [Gamsiella multidivaricata]|uniref:uncharacterized protein n=1 Tax=Gamsiella multidivaricata TaxID=101098 RepID=UPI00221F57F0|nr:uncharacterized protein BC939DRAFT_441674 [Gamsiella multidivaricata]KAG0369726.1 hypothetical protein BGZ54_009073 [Gamsiella multidivaricata]KAI7829363.1 hypothetical protein BC939DRAFT_441674 [Gamsiella multidivaricata]
MPEIYNGQDGSSMVATITAPIHEDKEDLYDTLPPEILDQILLHLDHASLFCCMTLSRRWSQCVIPHLWHSPYMTYYVSWMKLLKTVISTNPSASNACATVKSPKTNPTNGQEKCRKGSLDSSPERTASPPRAPQQQMNTERLSQDPYGRMAGSPEMLAARGGTFVRGFSVQEEGSSDTANGGDGDGGGEDDPSGLLRLAESQRQQRVQIGWGGNCTSEHQVSPMTTATADGAKGLRIARANVESTTTMSTVNNTHIHTHTSINSKDSNSPSSTLTKPIASIPKPTPFAHPAYGSLIRVLDFSHLYYIISDQFLTHLFPQIPLLQSLLITAPKQFSDTSLHILATSCPNLRRLELVGCTRISDAGLAPIYEQCQKIHVLNLSNSRSSSFSAGLGGITGETFTRLAAAGLPLHILSLANVNASITDQNPGLLSIALECKSLTSLNIAHCSAFVTDDLLCSLNASGLQTLNVACCSKITDRGIEALARRCPDLRELDITGLENVTDKGMMEIGRRCSRFWRLVMDEEDFQEGRMSEEVLRGFAWGLEAVRKRRPMMERRNSRIF